MQECINFQNQIIIYLVRKQREKEVRGSGRMEVLENGKLGDARQNGYLGSVLKL